MAVEVVLGEPAARKRHAIRGSGRARIVRVVVGLVVLGEPAARMRHAIRGSSCTWHHRDVAVVVVLDEPAARTQNASEAAPALVVAESWSSW